MFHLDFGHAPRAATPPAADSSQLVAAENAWFAKYVMGTGSTPANAVGGVSILTSHCPTTAAGTLYTAPNWASIAPGEIRYSDPTAKTITAPGTAPSSAFTSGSICTTTSGSDNASAATYRLDPAPAGGFTIAGAPTVSANMTVNSPNDGVYARIYDVDPNTNTEQLIGRQLYRPTGVGQANAPQLFQLHPQAWRVAPGHVVKLELLAQDSTYGRTASAAMAQQSIQVSDLKLTLPVVDSPGSLGGLVQSPAAKILPDGYRISRDANQAPSVSNDALGGTAESFRLGAAPDVTVSASDVDTRGGDLTESVTGLPAGVSLDPDTDSGSSTLPGTASWKLSGSSVTAPAGTYHVTVTIKDDYEVAGTTEFDIEVVKNPQTISFAAIPDHLLADADFDPGATASSGLGVSYALTGPCTEVGGLVHLTGVGSCQVTASQTGDDDYEPASDVSHTFTINQYTSSLEYRVLPVRLRAGKPLKARAKVISPGVKRVNAGHITFRLDGDPVGGDDITSKPVVKISGIDTGGLSSGQHTLSATYTDSTGVFVGSTAQRTFDVR
jgi:hypothetical protein